ncbi:HNH/endonuclease VII fold toxin-2 domain-containing protein [Metapseudomonas otitidis]|uniref:HNH/endonuclease VII fold toxin-2 domain-containing protein n=1 Tax=Metapseudomonas otitidis TaxID=319939 RepID=UPI002542082B|nr:HNH/endonuclease VII fold toxin-2 domain-containing protein [Pseudomonas otitidis]WIF70068.1 HNH/endonuclease VII fold toxin-2 domain-containing protein [Pseudomonas otitidis]
MGNQVYANGMEISCKAADGKSIAAFPDVCFTPPQAPPTPTGVPIPYPNTGLASDTTSGTRTVKITGKEVMLKDKSYFKTSYGDEAGCAPKKGIITSKIKGKVYFTAWSMNVKFESENVVRNLDLTTHNHASQGPNTTVWPYLDKAAVDAGTSACSKEVKKEKNDCADFKPYGSKDACSALGPKKKPSGKKSSPEADRVADKSAAHKCLSARRCNLQPYSPSGCCPQQTAHHLIEASALHDVGRGGKGSTPLKGIKDYNENKAPCVCAEGVNQNVGTHGLMHTHQSAAAAKARKGRLTDSKGNTFTAKKTTYKTAKTQSIQAMAKVFPQSKCSKQCIEAQLDHYHKNQCGMNDRTAIKAVETGQTDLQAANRSIAARNARLAAARGRGSR